GICVAKMLDNTQSIICAFGLVAAAPRSPYRYLELCGIALKAQKQPPPRMSNLSASGADFCTHFARSGGVCANVECMVKYR
ncbi:hypothetical protein, partial [Gemmiger formicilis]|uniref:hypothetical protein n=2 Tax=Gemmiger formicilis TaxID=745368 RepID=UPI003AF0F900